MSNPAIIYGEPIGKEFFYNLLIDKDSKYLTDFKRYFRMAHSSIIASRLACSSSRRLLKSDSVLDAAAAQAA